jgi:hypothetical protein
MNATLLLLVLGLMGEAPDTKGEATNTIRGATNTKGVAPPLIREAPVIRGGVLPAWGGVTSPSVEWTTISSDKTQIALMVNGKQVGNYHLDLNEYHPYDPLTDTFKGGENPPPHPLPANLLRKPEITNFGVNRLTPHTRERYIINGIDATGEEALQALQEKNVPNDKSLLRLTIIGPEALRKQVRSDIENHPSLTCFSEKYLVQDYAPENWAVKQGFFTEGKPTIYLQLPSGKVLHRQDDYADGAAGLATALRKADPNYAPEKDPDKRKPLVIPFISDYIPFAVLAFLALVLFLIPNKKVGSHV